MDNLTKLVAVGAIAAAIIVPAFTAIAAQGSSKASQYAINVSTDQKIEAEERKQQSQAKREEAKKNKLDRKVCVKTADKTFKETISELRTARNEELKELQEARKASFSEAKETRDQEIKAADGDKDLIRAAKEKYVSALKTLNDTRFTNRKETQQDYRLAKKTAMEERRAAVKDCRDSESESDTEDSSS